MLREIILGSAILVTSLGFSACSDSSSHSMKTPSYEISVTNLTAGQPMSPLAVVLHNENYKVYTLGESASVALENLAEGGDNSVLIDTSTSTTDVEQSFSASGLIAPGVTVGVTVDSNAGHLSLATMLVNTNDGFIGLNAYDLSLLSKGDEVTVELPTYDAGTEVNSETSGTVPAQGGEGFNADRDDSNGLVRIHAGVVTADDGLSSSALSSIHRFDNPTAKVTIKRIY